ncbi:glycosyltransferase [Candidatus Shapirobacteria bacterium]|nr:glycosyltransferase [Candidatus Shapirobacteria bacterium]
MGEEKKLVSVVIPAFNEEQTITGVVGVCLKTPEVGEIIVVNDASQDKTGEKLQIFKDKIKVINLPKNGGKGYAVAQGVKTARYDYLLFLDADLINLQSHHLSSLVWPVLNNQAEMTIAVLVSFYSPYYRSWPLSGQRCLKKSSFNNRIIKKMEKTGYGLEVFLNELMKKKRVAVIPWVSDKPLHLKKISKQQNWVKTYAKETFEVFRQTIASQRSSYQEKMKVGFLRGLAVYLKVSYKRLKDYLLEDFEE